MNSEKTNVVGAIVGGTVVVSVVGYLSWTFLKKPKTKEYPKDTVILHQLPRGPYAPSISQFVMKLETYLRMAKIPYLNVHGRTPSKKGKYPWIEYNGEMFADTEFIIEFLNKKFDVDLNKNLNPKSTSIGRAFQKMLEENTFFAVTLDRWYFDEETRGLRLIGISSIFIYFFRRKVKNMAYCQGIGRHSQEEIYHILDLDLQALSIFLGENKFLLGNEPSQVDAAIFGQLSQIYWHCFGNKSITYLKKYTNLCEYCERMKNRFWPDWDDCITKGGTQVATK